MIIGDIFAGEYNSAVGNAGEQRGVMRVYMGGVNYHFVVDFNSLFDNKSEVGLLTARGLAAGANRKVFDAGPDGSGFGLVGLDVKGFGNRISLEVRIDNQGAAFCFCQTNCGVYGDGCGQVYGIFGGQK